MEQRKTIGTQISQVRNFSLRRSLGKNFSNEPQITKVLLLCLQAERMQARRGLQRPQIDRSDELLVRAQAFEQTMNDSEQVLRQARFPDALIVLIPVNNLRKFLLEKVQSKVLLRFEIIKQSSLSDFGFPRDGPGRGLVEPFFGEKIQGGPKNRLPGPFLVFNAFAARAWGRRFVEGRFHTR